jgi:hypothetical protein
MVESRWYLEKRRIADADACQESSEPEHERARCTSKRKLVFRSFRCGAAGRRLFGTLRARRAQSLRSSCRELFTATASLSDADDVVAVRR